MHSALHTHGWFRLMKLKVLCRFPTLPWMSWTVHLNLNSSNISTLNKNTQDSKTDLLVWTPACHWQDPSSVVCSSGDSLGWQTQVISVSKLCRLLRLPIFSLPNLWLWHWCVPRSTKTPGPEIFYPTGIINIFHLWLKSPAGWSFCILLQRVCCDSWMIMILVGSS